MGFGFIALSVHVLKYIVYTLKFPYKYFRDKVL